MMPPGGPPRGRGRGRVRPPVFVVYYVWDNGTEEGRDVVGIFECRKSAIDYAVKRARPRFKRSKKEGLLFLRYVSKRSRYSWTDVVRYPTFPFMEEENMEPKSMVTEEGLWSV